MEKEFEFLSSTQQDLIYGKIWYPAEEPQAILQIVHGMAEHIQRYSEFAQYLATNGILVIGHDQLGHGNSAKTIEYGYFAEKDGDQHLLNDIHTVRMNFQKRYPKLPYFILGHSMGSYLVRWYLSEFGAGLAGAILMGTGQQPQAMVKVGMMIAQHREKKYGGFSHSVLLDRLIVDQLNRPFSNGETNKDWLTSDVEQVQKYLNDEKSGFYFTVNGYLNLLKIIAKIQESQTIEKTSKNVPLLFVSGADDPVGNAGKGVAQVIQRFEKSGLKKLTKLMYENCRHEILNEQNKQIVYGDILHWIQREKS